jgi:hypothetical protein
MEFRSQRLYELSSQLYESRRGTTESRSHNVPKTSRSDKLVK